MSEVGAALASAFRRTGADPPTGDPRRSHAARMEGYFWRFTDSAAGRVVVALCGVNRPARGRPWATVALAAHPGGRLVEADVDGAGTDADGLGCFAGTALRATKDRVVVDLGDGARLDAVLSQRAEWPRGRLLGPFGAAQTVPGLSQYWLPHVFGARVRGTVSIGGETWSLDGATAYAEKNWGSAFPPVWWWGQAQGFDRDDVCVAFAGGPIGVGPLQPPGVTATAIAVRVGRELVRLVAPGALVRRRDDGRTLMLTGRSVTGYAVTLTAEGDRAPAHPLPVPLVEDRRSVPRAHQFLGARLSLSVRRGRRLLFRGESLLAGLERGAPAVDRLTGAAVGCARAGCPGR